MLESMRIALLLVVLSGTPDGGTDWESLGKRLETGFADLDEKLDDCHRREMGIVMQCLITAMQSANYNFADMDAGTRRHQKLNDACQEDFKRRIKKCPALKK